MDSSKRVQLSALCIVVALFAATPAVGAQPQFRGSATLTAVGNETAASGHAALTMWLYYDPWSGTYGGGGVGVTCKGLTPGATYVVSMPLSYLYNNPDGVANAKGSLNIKSDWVMVLPEPDSVSLYRVEATGNILVLSGTIQWQQTK